MNLEKLIECVKNYPYLYETSNEQYKNIKLKDDTWRSLSEELNGNAKEEWKKLRDCHRDALKRKVVRSGQEGQLKKKWKFEEQMAFLLPSMTHRERHSNLQEERKTYQLQVQDMEEEMSCSSSAGTEEIKSVSCTPKSGKKVDPILEYLEKNRKEREARRKSRSTDEGKDDLYYFFMSMLQSTKKLPKTYQRQIKSILFSAVQEAEAQVELEESTSDNSLYFTNVIE